MIEVSPSNTLIGNHKVLNRSIMVLSTQITAALRQPGHLLPARQKAPRLYAPPRDGFVFFTSARMLRGQTYIITKGR